MTDVPGSGGFGPFRALPNELLVAIPHEAEVRVALAGMGVTSDLLERSEALGLARLQLEWTAEVVVSKTGPLPQGQGLDQIDRLDQVLAKLRAGFRAKYGRWAPTMGKNRSIESVLSAGEVTFGGEGSPRLADPPPEWPPRTSEPGCGVSVGVLDTGIAQQAGWLSGGWLAQYSDILAPEGNPPAHAGHATFLTGLVLSQAPGATVQLRRVLDEDGVADSWEVAKAIVDFGSTGIDVLNLSFACYTEDGRAPLALATAIDRLDPNIVVVAAAGNHGNLPENPEPGKPSRLSPAWPAALDDVVAVGAATREREPADFSPKAPWVDLLAAGVDVVSTFFQGAVTLPPDQADPRASAPRVEEFRGFAEWNGTSFAAALVSGAIAAGTRPGRVSARASYEDIRRTLHDGRQSPSVGAQAQDGDAPFLALRLL